MISTWLFAIVFSLFSLFGLSLFFFVRFMLREMGVNGALRRLQRVPIRRVQHGQIIKAVGKVDYAGSSLLAPISGKPCAYYELITEQRLDGVRNGRWIPIKREQKFQDFFLQDETGKALVQLNPSMLFSYSSEKPLLESNALALNTSANNTSEQLENFRYQERRLEAGETIAVIGRGTWEQDPGAGASFSGYRKPSSCLVVRAPGKIPLHISDDSSVCH